MIYKPCGVACGILLIAFSPQAAVAQNRWARQVQSELQRALHAARAHDGAQTVLNKQGTLNQEESASFTVTLRQGVTYSILGVCDEDCPRLRLVVATLTNSELAMDRNSENFPVLRFTPQVTAQYRIRVAVEECRVNPCWYAAGVIPETGQER